MLQAVIFDCDGVIADNEPLHLRMFQKVLAEEGLHLTDRDYYAIYLGMDDKGCFSAFYGAQHQPLDSDKMKALITRKARCFEDALRTNLRIFPGVVRLVRELAPQRPLAIASGALRHEIETILASAGLRDAFQTIVSAEDVLEGKPSPEGFFAALQRLRAHHRPPAEITPAGCVVIEDSIAGIEAARAAGMRCLAVTNSYPSSALQRADRIVDSLEKITEADLERLCASA